MWARISERIEDLLLLAGVGLMFSLVKTLAVPSNRTFRNFLITLVVCVPCGTLAGAVVKESGYGDYVSLAATALISIFADRMIGWLLDTKRITDMDEALRNLITKYTK